jgi:hypothetical protein
MRSLIVSASAADEHYRHEADAKEYGPCRARDQRANAMSA